MTTRSDLRVALEILTEGGAAPIPKNYKSKSFTAEVVRIEKASRPWTQGKGIQGVGIGHKHSVGKSTGDLVLKVYVEKKRTMAGLNNPVPKSVKIGSMKAMPTDVEEIGKVQAETFTQRVRPAMPGCGLIHPAPPDSVGTFGCLVKKTKNKKTLYILSNSHVLANEGLAAIGDHIVQPGTLDGGTAPADSIATLAEFVPFDFTTATYPNFVDAAIAKVTRKGDVIDKIRILNVKPQGSSSVVRIGMAVHKVGRTTDYTTGEIKDIDYRLALNYAKPGGGKGRVGFRDQVLCTRYTAGGDSGSAVLSKNSNKVVGLHFAGSPSTSIFNKITHVLSLLDIQIA